jgi:pilus assembly protein CpaE
VVDTAPASTSRCLALDETDECIVVATLDVPTLKNVKMSHGDLDLLNLATGHRYLVLNRADEEVGLTPAKVETILSMGVTVQSRARWTSPTRRTTAGRSCSPSRTTASAARSASSAAGSHARTRDGTRRGVGPRRSAACSAADAWRSHEQPE